MEKFTIRIPVNTNWPDEYLDKVIRSEVKMRILDQIYEAAKKNNGFILLHPLEIEIPKRFSGVDFGFTGHLPADQDYIEVKLKYSVVEKKIERFVTIESSVEYVNEIKKLRFKERIIYLLTGKLPFDVGVLP